MGFDAGKTAMPEATHVGQRRRPTLQQNRATATDGHTLAGARTTALIDRGKIVGQGTATTGHADPATAHCDRLTAIGRNPRLVAGVSTATARAAMGATALARASQLSWRACARATMAALEEAAR